MPVLSTSNSSSDFVAFNSCKQRLKFKSTDVRSKGLAAVQSLRAAVAAFKGYNQRSWFKVMEKVRRFADLEVFQKARELCKNVYTIQIMNRFKVTIGLCNRYEQQLDLSWILLQKVMNVMETKSS